MLNPSRSLLFVVLVACSGCISRQLSDPLGAVPHKSMVLVGPVGGLNRNFHSGGFRTIDEPACPMFEQGGGWGYALGLSAEYIPDVRDSWSLIARTAYENRPGTFQQQLPDVPVLLEGSSTPTEQSVTTTSKVMYRMISAEAFYKQDLTMIGSMRIAVAGGPSVAYILGGENRQTQDLIKPENAKFVNPLGLATENLGRRLIYYDGDIPGLNSFRFSMKAGLQAEVPLFNNQWIMTPGIYYDYGVTDVTSSENWQLNSILFTVDFRHAF